MIIVAIGMDPGPTPGLVRLTYSEQRLISVEVVQCTANVWARVLTSWLADQRRVPCETYFQGEKFVIGRSSYRSGSPGAVTRDMVGESVQVCVGRAIVTLRSASETKAWATDKRLDAAGITRHTKGMTHARDAARHALFTAVAEGNIPDPLSRKALKAQR